MNEFKGFEIEEKDIPKYLLAGLIGRLTGLAVFGVIYFLILRHFV